MGRIRFVIFNVEKGEVKIYEVKPVVCDYGVFEDSELKLILNSNANAQLIKTILEVDDEHKIYEVLMKRETESKANVKKRCTACNGSGWYDNTDKHGNNIKCGACDGTGFEVE